MLIAVAGGVVLVILAAVAWFVMNRPAGDTDSATDDAAVESAPDLDAPPNETAPATKPSPDAKPWKPPKPQLQPPGPLDDLRDVKPES